MPPHCVCFDTRDCYNRSVVSQVYFSDEQMSQLCSRFVNLCLMVIFCLQIFLLCHRFAPHFTQEKYLPPSVLISNAVFYVENDMITGISSNISCLIKLHLLFPN